MFDLDRARHRRSDVDDGTDPRTRLAELHQRARSDDAETRAGPDYAAAADGPRHDSSLSRWAGRWLPEPLARSRVDPGRLGLLAIGAVAAVLVVVFGLTLLGRGPAAEPAPPPPLITPAAAATTTSAPAEELVVSVVGRVAEPGLVTVPPGARVADALDAAGGAVPGTDITALNLARRLVDGEQLYVAVPVPPQALARAPGASPGEPGKLDLNTATEEQLDELPGVGEVTAQRIVRWRAEHGRFTSVEQLRDVDGIGEVRFSRLRDLVRT